MQASVPAHCRIVQQSMTRRPDHEERDGEQWRLEEDALRLGK
ncbi:MAG: hypothetical protein ACREOZ_02365 [Gloeomargaritales cyanobacterium]